MKRQGSNIDSATPLQQSPKNEGRKKSKRTVTEAKEIDGKKNGELTLANLYGWDEWPWFRGAADEQMSWGSVWSPFWDVDFVDMAYSAFFSDVAWDDDIWNLKTITEIPKP